MSMPELKKLKNKIINKKAFVTSPDGTVETIDEAIVMNLLVAKGPNAKGKIYYVDDLKTFLQEPKNDEVSGNIIVTDTIDQMHYPILSALSAAAVITNSMDYDEFTQLVVVNSGVGIFSGFGKFPFDDEIKKYLQSLHGHEIFIDTLYNRVVIPTEKLPKALSDYEFDLGNILGYK